MTKIGQLFMQEMDEAVKAEQEKGKAAVKAEQERGKAAVKAEQERSNAAIRAEQDKTRSAKNKIKMLEAEKERLLAEIEQLKKIQVETA